jgi:heme-degrading monooxygenase HmoA
MFVLHVELKVKPGLQKDLEETYVGIFSPAITQQAGFQGVNLLRPAEEGDEYRLSIAFEDRASQQKWVATDLHATVWPRIEGHCLKYSVKNYYAV